MICNYYPYNGGVFHCSRRRRGVCALYVFCFADFYTLNFLGYIYNFSLSGAFTCFLVGYSGHFAIIGNLCLSFRLFCNKYLRDVGWKVKMKNDSKSHRTCTKMDLSVPLGQTRRLLKCTSIWNTAVVNYFFYI